MGTPKKGSSSSLSWVTVVTSSTETTSTGGGGLEPSFCFLVDLKCGTGGGGVGRTESDDRRGSSIGNSSFTVIGR